MHTQRRYGTPSRPKNDDHTVWDKPDDGWPLDALLLAVVGIILTLAALT